MLLTTLLRLAWLLAMTILLLALDRLAFLMASNSATTTRVAHTLFAPRSAAQASAQLLSALLTMARGAQSQSTPQRGPRTSTLQRRHTLSKA